MFKIPVLINPSWLNTVGMNWVESGAISKVDLFHSVKYVYLDDIYKPYVTVYTQFSEIIVPKFMLSVNNNMNYWDEGFINMSIKERMDMFLY